MLLALHVDDFILLYQTEPQLAWVLSGLGRSYGLKDLGELTYALGTHFIRNELGISLTQREYTLNVLKKFGFAEAHPTHTPYLPTSSNPSLKPTGLEKWHMNEIVGSLIWLSIISRPDITYAVARLAQSVSDAKPMDYRAAARVLRYLRGTPSHGIQYPHKSKDGLVAYVDADFAADDDRKSQTGFILFFGGGPVAYKSTKQGLVALSTAEAELNAAVEAGKEALWFRTLFTELSIPLRLPITLLEDNAAAITLSDNSVMGKRTKHIDLRYCWINDKVQDGTLKLVKVTSSKNIADLLTKPLARDRFQHLVSLIVS